MNHYGVLSKIKATPWFTASLFGLLCWLAGYLLVLDLEQKRNLSTRNFLHSELRSLSGELSALVDQSIYLTHAIQAHIRNYNHIELDDFSGIAQELLGHSEYLKNISLIKGVELVSVYPLQGNESAIGLRFDQTQIDGFERAKNTGRPALVGPISLVQGGRGLIVRNPVFLRDGQYWGQISAVLDWDLITARVGLSRFGESFALSMVRLTQNSDVAVWPAERLRDAGPIVLSQSLSLPLTEWQLRLHSEQPLGLPSKALWLAALSLMTAFLSILLYQYLLQVGLLAQQKEQAEALSHSRGQLLLSTVHDLRQPVGALGIALSQYAQSHKQSSLDHALLCLNSINEFFDQLSDYEQLEEGKLVDARAYLDLPQFLQELMQEFELACGDKEIALVFERSGIEAIAVYSDKVLLARILRNLLGNAVKYTEQGHIRISCCPWRHNGAEISIEDSGMGIPEDELCKVTQAFYQVAAHKHKAANGIGLGLDIVRRLCQLLEIEFKIESCEGQGTRALLLIPFETQKKPSSPVAGVLRVRLIQQDQLPDTLKDKMAAWNIELVDCLSGSFDMLVTRGGQLDLHEGRHTLIIDSLAEVNERINERVWRMSASSPVSAIRMTMLRIAKEVESSRSA